MKEFNSDMALFDVKIYSEPVQYNDTLSSAKCLIFYKGANRNGTYITEEFAEKLIKTLPYTPVKGIYNEEEEDYTDHGQSRAEGKIYGVVPQDYNFEWIKIMDEDGVEREYASCDVLLFSSIYPEAAKIYGKSLSMEIYRESIQGDWKPYADGQEYFVFENGSFLGLQVLGDKVEPCFEGAQFFTLYKDLEERIKQIESDFQKNEKEEKEVEIKFNFSDSELAQKLYQLMNPVEEQATEWTIGNIIYNIQPEYCYVWNCEKECTQKISYKVEEDGTYTLGEPEEICELIVTPTEFSALEAAKEQNENTFEKIDEVFTKVSALETEKTELMEKQTELEGELNTLQENFSTLKQFKEEQENKEKTAIIEKYSKKLNEEIIEKYSSKLGEYTIVDLDKELAYELVQADDSLFELEDGTYANKIDEPNAKDSICAILDSYENKNEE